MSKLIKNRDGNFTHVKNDIFESGLSAKAMGIFCYLWHLPDDWKFYEDEITKHFKDGKSSIRSGLKELQNAKFLVRKQIHDEKSGKIIRYDWQLNESPVCDYPKLDKPKVDEPKLENRTLQSTKRTKYLSTNNATTTADAQNSNSELKDKFTAVLTFYQQNIGVLNPITTEDIAYWCNDLSPEVVTEAIRRTAQSNKNWRYTTGILRDWAKHNIRTLDQVKASDVEFQKKNEAKYGKRKNNKPAPQYQAGDDAYRKMAQNEAEGKLPWED